MQPAASRRPPVPAVRAVRRDRILALGAFALAALLIGARLGGLPLLQPDEGRNAEIAREMKSSGAWFVPTYNDFPYLDKPAFYFKSVALSLGAFGENEAAARLPSALSAAGVFLLVFWFCRREYGARTAALAVAIVSATPFVIAFARTVIFDMMLAFFVTLSILSAYVAEEKMPREGRLWYALAAAAAGCATLVKGPVGFIVPSLGVLAFNAVERRRGALGRFFAPLNLAVFFALVLPWFFAVSRTRPDFPHYGIVEETLRRYTTHAFHRSAPFYYYAPVILACLFPWSALLPEASVAAARTWRRLVRADRLLIVWAVVVVLFFSTSQSKLPGYVLTAVIAAGVLAARVWARAFDAPQGRAARLVRRATVALAAAAAVAAALLAVEASAPGKLQALFHSHSTEFVRWGPAAAPMAATLALVAAAAVAARATRRLAVSFAAFLIFPLSLLTVNFGALRAYAESASSRPLARAMPALDRDVPIACLECFPGGLPFYEGRTLTLVTEDGRELTSHYAVYALKNTSVWPANIVPRASWNEWLRARRNAVYVLSTARARAALEEAAAERNATVTALVPGWWGALLPPPHRPEPPPPETR